MTATVDVFIIGGGINGCGIARDAAGRGFSVALAEMNDLASGTSSWSTKLVHGGLRYLEHYEFRLVREALREREVLLALAPHIIRPLRFILPHHSGLRPAWMLRLGLFLYDHIGGRRRLPGTRVVDLRDDEAGRALKPSFTRAFEYSDCRVDDARLVVLNAQDAAQKGASIHTRTKVVSAAREAGAWSIVLEDQVSGKRETVRSRLLVNAAGPWVEAVLTSALNRPDERRVRLVQGSHIVVRRLFRHDRAYIFQNDDKRIVFAIPYEGDYTLIGTTDRDFAGDPANVSITQDEVDYLLAATSDYFADPIGRDDIVWTYSGVRPLYDDGTSSAQEATRDYVLTSEGETDEPQLLNIFGGKITTYRKLAEAMLEKVEQALGRRRPAWTATAPLPGGGFDAFALEEVVGDFRRAFPFVDEAHARRLVRLYGLTAWALVGERARSVQDLGRHFGADLYQVEVDHLVAHEWARSAEDILWRRTKLGLRLSPSEVEALSTFLETRTTRGRAIEDDELPIAAPAAA